MFNVDLLIIGGGLVGASLAAAVRSHPLAKDLRILLVDPSPPSTQSWPPTSLRTSTISPSSKMFLDEIGVWDRISVDRIAVFDKMFVWDHPYPLPGTLSSTEVSRAPAGTIVFNAKDIGHDHLGYVLDNDTLRNAMFRRIRDIVGHQTEGLQVIQGSVKTIKFADDDSEADASEEEDSVPWPLVELESGETIQCRLIAACDGSRSRVRTICGADWFQYGYGQNAVVANVQLKDIITTAYQRFVSTGPVAVLPVSTEDTLAPVGNVIWTTTPAEAKALLNAGEAHFINELNLVLAAHEDEEQVFASSFYPPETEQNPALWRLVAKGLQAILPKPAAEKKALNFIPPPEATRVIGKRGQFPLTLGHSPRYVLQNRRTVLVGDAAHSVHPLAGQGVNLGFADAQSLAECIASAAGTGRDLGGEKGAPLMRYQSERMASNLGMIGVLHGLQRVFGVQNSTFRDFRRVGISALNFANPLKKIILRAMR